MYQIDFNKPINIHFIGIGGISMSGLAEILLDRGFGISGSDAKEVGERGIAVRHVSFPPRERAHDVSQRGQ